MRRYFSYWAGTHFRAVACEKQAEAHYERPSKRDELDVLDSRNHGVHEYTSAPCQTRRDRANQRNERVLTLGVFNITLGRSIELLHK